MKNIIEYDLAYDYINMTIYEYDLALGLRIKLLSQEIYFNPNSNFLQKNGYLHLKPKK